MTHINEAARKRVRAGQLMLAGKSPAEAAREVGVARQTAYAWKERLDEGGIEALQSMGSGRPAQLDSTQLETLRCVLMHGAAAQGFDSDRWTLKRVGILMERMYSVRFSEVHVGRLLRAMDVPAKGAAARAEYPNSTANPRRRRKASIASTGPRVDGVPAPGGAAAPSIFPLPPGDEAGVVERACGRAPVALEPRVVNQVACRALG
ncbi:helix-turn-helix domain-containing protein [Paraburkholderia sp. A1RI_3L]|uniref:helix-turn-helix domain-containing protein n=1 Tax=Paraburkholderia TaxID=1822464 RepID=UPI003B821BEE